MFVTSPAYSANIKYDTIVLFINPKSDDAVSARIFLEHSVGLLYCVQETLFWRRCFPLIKTWRKESRAAEKVRPKNTTPIWSKLCEVFFEHQSISTVSIVPGLGVPTIYYRLIFFRNKHLNFGWRIMAENCRVFSIPQFSSFA